jgi:hypothetical protein
VSVLESRVSVLEPRVSVPDQSLSRALARHLLIVVRNYRSRMSKRKAAGEKVKAAPGNGFDNDLTSINDRPVCREI